MTRKQPEAAGVPRQSVEGRLARLIYTQRRLRDRILGSDLFGEPAWDMLLDLFASQEQQQRIYVTSLCLASNVPPTTALRRVSAMVEQGYLVRKSDDRDGRRVWVELSPDTMERMRRLLRIWPEEGLSAHLKAAGEGLSAERAETPFDMF